MRTNTNRCLARVQANLDAGCYLRSTPVHSLKRLKEMLPFDGIPIHTIRQAFFESNVPFRVEPCPRNYPTCCGMCTQSCSKRCVQDCMHRMYLYFQKDVAEWPLELRLLHEALKFASYPQIALQIGQICSYGKNRGLRERIMQYGIPYVDRHAQQPHKMNYSPELVTPGHRELVEWPSSGLCPYCAPVFY